ncbi:MAG: hypothetical protein FWF79_07120 [Defluviitaleaceae bacterium]|nr:hypothetical protein [Defluviitaleaceae bacterium]
METNNENSAAAIKPTIGVCGFHHTGSDALCNLLCEFEGTKYLAGEFRIINRPDGLRNLDTQLNHFGSFESSDIAITRFKQLVDNLIDTTLFFRHLSNNKEISFLTRNFLDTVIQIKWNKKRRLDYENPKKLWMLVRKYSMKILKMISHSGIGNNKVTSLYKSLYNTPCVISIFPEDFDFHAKKYITDILSIKGADSNKVTILNKPFHSTDPVSCFKYFENPKAIIVNRDPRDVYIYARKFLGFKELVPTENVEDFINFYRITRQNMPAFANREDVLLLNFESLVYDYDNTIKTLADFIGEGATHSRKGEFFNLEKATSQTQLFKNYPEEYENINKIEKSLPEFLFPFQSE